ncbi:MAG TPA: nicotinamide riboside transporter PnuC [Chryseosolibacter sp.]
MDFFHIDNIFFTVWGYEVSYLEFFGMLSGIIAVVLSSLANVWSWPIGIINVTLSFFLFFQVQLYPDMFLQVFFFVTNVMGWWRWTHPKPHEEDRKHELRVSFMKRKDVVLVTMVGLTGTFLLGLFAQNLHDFFPTIFTKPSAAPYLDSFITVMSVITTFYMIQKKIECWVIWLLVDIVATYLYFVRDIKLYGMLYLAFCFIAAFALWNWVREYRSYKHQNT